MAKRRQEEPKKGAPEWMATFSDLVTLLFCFFVLLYAMSSIDAGKLQAFSASFRGEPALVDTEATQGLLENLGVGITEMPDVAPVEENVPEQTFDTMDQELEEMYSDFQTYFAENNLQDKIEVTKKNDYLDVTLKDNILFDKGKDQIRGEAIPILESISNLLLTKYPQSNIEIIGHTDNDPINVPRFPSNWYLSAARAINVCEYFIKQKGFSPQSISAIGRGEFDPLVPNDTEANKSKNRRVEMRVYSSFISTDYQ